MAIDPITRYVSGQGDEKPRYDGTSVRVSVGRNRCVTVALTLGGTDEEGERRIKEQVADVADLSPSDVAVLDAIYSEVEAGNVRPLGSAILRRMGVDNPWNHGGKPLGDLMGQISSLAGRSVCIDTTATTTTRMADGSRPRTSLTFTPIVDCSLELLRGGRGRASDFAVRLKACVG